MPAESRLWRVRCPAARVRRLTKPSSAVGFPARGDEDLRLRGRVLMPLAEVAPETTIGLFADPEGHVIGIR
ncbi:MAG TPA: hypothetical protein VFJ71_03760 [Candidatus Limnocylindrales bacterium]|nr:hypothetical protein [Candidatus Limnocylindrales bacterium]